MNSVIKCGLLALTLVLLASGGAQAQYPGGPMDQLGNSIDRQIELQQQGDDMANRAGWDAYYMMQQNRAMGLPVPDGPLLPYRPTICEPEYDPYSQRTRPECR